MKLKFLFPVLFICLSATIFSARTNAQKKPFEVSISMKDQTLWLNSAEWLVKVKITNLSDKVFDTKECGLLFRFKKASPESGSGNAQGGYAVAERLIKPGEAFEFEADLKNLEWVEPSKSSVFILEHKNKAPYQPVLSGIYSLSATISKSEESGSGKSASRKMKVTSVASNALAVKIDWKTDK